MVEGGEKMIAGMATSEKRSFSNAAQSAVSSP